jgi:hypothetical protein
MILLSNTSPSLKTRHQRTLKLIFARPVSGNVKWPDILALFTALGADVTERAGSRVAVILFNQVMVMHRPHPSPDVDKGALVALRGWLEENGIKP